MSRKEPPSDKIERGADNESIEFHRNADLITELGDGIQAFVGLIAGLFSLQDTIILIDEPEAFLADPIARRLGFELTKIAEERKAALIIATHRADFIMGCLEASNDLKIIRLTYLDQKATAREIETNVIREFNTNPCLRSSAAIKGLFHKGVIVAEAHGDRVFYDEVNRRLINISKGIKDVLFIDSGGGIDQIFKTISPLRQMGVPTAAIVDMDFIKKGNKKKKDNNNEDSRWDQLVAACQISANDLSFLKEMRERGIQIFDKIKKNNEPCPYVHGGINNISDETEKDDVKNLIDTLSNYGLFVVPTGALESWIPGLKKGPEWHNGWLKNVGDPAVDSFNSWWGLNKWSFMHKIAEWINDPNRKGVG